MQKYQDEAWLRSKIEGEGMTQGQIGEKFGVSVGTIKYFADKYGIVRPGNTKTKENMAKAKILQDREWLYHEYITLNKSYEMIVQENGVGKTTVARWVKRHGLDKLKCTKTSGKRANEGPKVETTCANCGEDIEVKHCRYIMDGINRFCGRGCAAKYRAEHTDFIDELQAACGEWRKTPEAKLFMREHGAQVVADQDGRETSIERKIREMLTDAGIEFEAQKKMYYWCVDFYLPKYDIVIEAQGDYWHAHPDSYPEPNAMQRRSIRRDKGKEAYLTKCGHTFLAFWERDINGNIEGVLREIRTTIALLEVVAS
ncbi:DUF559 domain-containing protein [Sporosarcina koreensis]|uniref:DUF559 domain-containing protein n=1 Tax=Sporosarcina koreensis TaxID=334735 RepID=UPI00075ABA2A|nr:DUF559 domain-containing protein [Sporosarcina koreensis]